MINRLTFRGLLRERGEGHARVSSFELFFDLVYVFAVTQLSHHLLEHLTLRGLFQSAILLSAIWVAWVYTAWFTNWLDPDKRPVRIVLIGVMLASLIMSSSIPDAFGERGMTFALAYVVLQVGRSIFVIASTAEAPPLRLNFQRIASWALFSGIFWIAGGLAEAQTRELLWLIAVGIDFAAPFVGFYTPSLGRSTTHDWAIDGTHLAERCQLFLIVALGESVLVMGATFGDLERSTSVIAALVVAFLGTVSLWWIYFDRTAEAANEIIAQTSDPGRLGRSGYTFLHIPMVAGIIVTAVGDELVIAHPSGHAETTMVAAVIGGPALFLIGHQLFKYVTFNHFTYSRPVALAAFALLAVIGRELSPLLLSAAVTLVVGGVIYADVRYARQADAADEFAVDERLEEDLALEAD